MTAPPNFNPLARPYRWLEYLTFGPFLQRCRCHFLPRILQTQIPMQTLVLGDGDGRFTARLLNGNPAIRVDAVDASSAMLAELRRRTKGRGVRTHCADARAWQPETTVYGLIATHFFLDCLTTMQVTALAERLTPATAAHAYWVISEFATPPTPFGHLIAAPTVAALYWVFRRLTGLEPQALPDYRGALERAGWSLESEHSHLCGLLVSELWRRVPPGLI